VALGSIALVVAMLGYALLKRRRDDLTMLAATVTFTLLGNALICGVISGPHDRYGARMAWLATLTVLLAISRYFGDDSEEDSLPA
jgi:hypothetical protein